MFYDVYGLLITNQSFQQFQQPFPCKNDSIVNKYPEILRNSRIVGANTLDFVIRQLNDLYGPFKFSFDSCIRANLYYQYHRRLSRYLHNV